MANSGDDAASVPEARSIVLGAWGSTRSPASLRRASKRSVVKRTSPFPPIFRRASARSVGVESSLRGAKRRSNPGDIERPTASGLLRCARNDEAGSAKADHALARAAADGLRGDASGLPFLYNDGASQSDDLRRLSLTRCGATLANIMKLAEAQPAECSLALLSVLHREFPLQRVIVDGRSERNAVIEAHATGARVHSPLLTGRSRPDPLCLRGRDAT
jgi:hypothetical protein